MDYQYAFGTGDVQCITSISATPFYTVSRLWSSRWRGYPALVRNYTVEHGNQRPHSRPLGLLAHGDFKLPVATLQLPLLGEPCKSCRVIVCLRKRAHYAKPYQVVYDKRSDCRYHGLSDDSTIQTKYLRLVKRYFCSLKCSPIFIQRYFGRPGALGCVFKTVITVPHMLQPHLPCSVNATRCGATLSSHRIAALSGKSLHCFP